MYNWGQTILSLTMVVVALWIVNKFLGIFLEKKKRNLLGTLTWILYAAYQVIVEFWGNSTIWITIISFAMVVFIAITNYVWIGNRNIFVSVLFHVVWAMDEILVFFCLSSLGMGGEEYRIIGVVISKIIMIVGVYILALCWKKQNVEVIPTKYYLVLMFVPIGSIYIAYNDFKTIESTDNMFSVLVTVSILFLLNIIILEIYSKLSENFLLEKEKAVYERQLEMMSRNTEEQKKMMETFHEEKHNWINELIVLKSNIENSDKGGAVENINRIIKTCDTNEKISNSGNNVIDAIVNFKYTIAKEYGVVFRLKIFVPDVLPINQCDIGIVLGNAIDNAIDAVKACRFREKVIEIFMGIKKEALVLMIRNPYEHVLKKDKLGNLLSTKEASHKHGYGVNSIIRVAEKYQGEVLIDTKENVFTITVIMNLE